MDSNGQEKEAVDLNISLTEPAITKKNKLEVLLKKVITEYDTHVQKLASREQKLI
ncbi:39821_t:CDS:2 [Gigaspora margarita]|uniref:39821_t:CDS:1 n=1 Tax=Gigaspora margarita TaxID=4874 RepID=A0ABN7UDC4_GIGMA|nr:39821_t:CDS:2 [Gigaspora margarita]